MGTTPCSCLPLRTTSGWAPATPARTPAGWGAFSPAPLSDAILTQLRDEIVRPTLASLRNRGIDYRGTLFAGLMLTADGPKLLEYNVRFGDPETQVVVSRIESDVAQLLASAAAGHIDANVAISNEAMVTVVCAAPGYPLAPQTGAVITGLAAAQAEPGVTIFGAGVGLSPSGELVTAGGRVLSVTGRGATLDIARQRAYAAVAHIDWPGMVARDDICASVPSDDTQ
jgi:phosphoribosylamine--glycine ligase